MTFWKAADIVSGGRTITGGCCLIRYPPSVRSANFASEPRLVRVSALASVFRARLIAALSAVPASCSITRSASRRVYQTSRKRIVAAVAIVVRYAATAARAAARSSLRRQPLPRAATTKLAARRLTSHSNGAGSVSSKSLRSNTSRRSGAAKTPKFDRCASPQPWTRNSVVGVHDRSHAMIAALPR